MKSIRKGGPQGKTTKAGAGTVRVMKSAAGGKVAYYNGPKGVSGNIQGRPITQPQINRNSADIASMKPLQLRNHFIAVEAGKLLKKEGIGVETYTNAELMKMADQKGVMDLAKQSANKLYNIEITRRKKKGMNKGRM